MIKRLTELRNLHILDTEEEEIFNDIVKTASEICDAPISLISLLEEERQWFKAKQGIDIDEGKVVDSFCRFTIEEPSGEMIINNAVQDKRFSDNVYVANDPHLRSYMGMSLKTSNGINIGTVCVIDYKEREFTEKQKSCLRSLSNFAMKLIEEKVLQRKLQNQNEILKTLNKNLETFAYSVAHDVKAPLKQIHAFSDLLMMESKNELKEEHYELLKFIASSAKKLTDVTSNLLTFSKKVQVDTDEYSIVNTKPIIEEILDLLDSKREHLQYEIDPKLPSLFTSKLILTQAFQNIISNSIKYRNNKLSKSILKISAIQKGNYIRFDFEDNGIGISKVRLSEIFSIFNRNLNYEDSTGVGLSVVKELMSKIGGKIKISSEPDEGTVVSLYFHHTDLI